MSDAATVRPAAGVNPFTISEQDCRGDSAAMNGASEANLLRDPETLQRYMEGFSEAQLYSLLPFGLADILDLVSLEALARLIAEHGGQRIYIPKRAEGSQMAAVVGLEAATALCDRYGGDHLDVPVARRLANTLPHAEIFTRFQAGESANALAREYACSRRTIFRIAAIEREAGNRRKARRLKV